MSNAKCRSIPLEVLRSFFKKKIENFFNMPFDGSVLHSVICCIFAFDYLHFYLCIRYLVISVLTFLDKELSENLWFVWPKT